MIGQVPLVYLTEPLEKMRGSGTTIGNCIFWISFCLVGQPFGALYYFYRYITLFSTNLDGIVCTATDNRDFMYIVSSLILDKYIQECTLSTLYYFYSLIQRLFK